MTSILKNYSILYVEDNAETCRQMKEYLDTIFSFVYIASCAEEALILYQRHSPHVLLLDINLPSIDGLTLAKKIRNKNSLIKIIMLTGVTETSKLLLATELNLTKYIIKPIVPKEFKQTLEKLALELKNIPSPLIYLSEESIWNKEEEKLFFKEENVLLSVKEHYLLKLFIRYKGKCVAYTDIMLAVWEESFEKEISINSVKNQVSILRKKLPKGIISSVYGRGYILR